MALAYIGLQGLTTAVTERGHTDSPTGTQIVIASPPPLWSFSRDIISGGNGLYTLNDDTTLPGIPLDSCDLAAARASDSQIEAFLFWARTPFIVPREDGTLWIQDARFTDPSTSGRFEVELPTRFCPTIRTERTEGQGG